MSNPENAAPTTAQEATPQPQRRRRASTGGLSLKLDAEQRAGYKRRWVNGDPVRIRQMEELGYSIVSEKAQAEGKNRTEGLGTIISRHAGRDKDDKPFQAVLMETPDNLFAEGETEKETGREAFEESIRRGAKTEDTPDGAYLPSRSSITHSG